MSIVSLVVAHLPIPLAQLVVCFGKTQIICRSVRTKRYVEVFADQKRLGTVFTIQEVWDLSGHFVLLRNGDDFSLGFFNPRKPEDGMTRSLKIHGYSGRNPEIAMLSTDSVFLCNERDVRILRLVEGGTLTQHVLPPLPVPRSYHGVVKVRDHQVLVLAGFCAAHIVMYQAVAGAWQHFVLDSRMPGYLCWAYYPVIWQNKTLFIFASDVRSLCLETQEWTYIKVDFPLRSFGGAIAFPKNIWVLCEWQDSQKHCLSFDPSTGTFQKSHEGDFLGTHEDLGHSYFSSMNLWDDE